jgi:hypothetical protein
MTAKILASVSDIGRPQGSGYHSVPDARNAWRTREIMSPTYGSFTASTSSMWKWGDGEPAAVTKPAAAAAGAAVTKSAAAPDFAADEMSIELGLVQKGPVSWWTRLSNLISK